MLNAGMVEHYAPMGSCTMDDMVACLVLRSYALMPLLVLLAILVLPPAHSTAQCRGADTSCYFLRPCHDNKPLRGHSSRRLSCAGADAASSYVFGGVGPFGDPGRVVQNLPNKNFVILISDFLLVDYGYEPHLLDGCTLCLLRYGGVDPFGDPGRMVQNLSLIESILIYHSAPTIRCEPYCCLRACLVALAPLLGLACMLGSGVHGHYAYLDCCTMQAMMVCLLMHSFALLMLLSLAYSTQLLAVSCSDLLRTGREAYHAVLSDYHLAGTASRHDLDMRHTHVIFDILILLPAHSTTLCKDVDLALYFLRPCCDSKPLRGYSCRRPRCAGIGFAGSHLFGGVGPFGEPGRVVQNLPNQYFMVLF